MSKSRVIKLAPKESVEIKFSKGRVELWLGSRNNKVVIEYLSPWFNFKDKDKSLTSRPYVYDPQSYDPKRGVSRARKLLGEDEPLVLGSVRNRIYFSEEGEWDDKLEPEHVKLVLKKGRKLLIENMSFKDLKLKLL